MNIFTLCFEVEAQIPQTVKLSSKCMAPWTMAYMCSCYRAMATEEIAKSCKEGPGHDIRQQEPWPTSDENVIPLHSA